METPVGQKKLKNWVQQQMPPSHFGHAHHSFVSLSPVDGPAEIQNLNLPNAKHNALFQVNASVQWRLLVVPYRRFGIVPTFNEQAGLNP
jgi:hypothetical protein